MNTIVARRVIVNKHGWAAMLSQYKCSGAKQFVINTGGFNAIILLELKYGHIQMYWE